MVNKIWVRGMTGPDNGINAFLSQLLPTHCGQMRLGIVLHKEEPRAHYTSVRSDNCSEDFISVPNSIQRTAGYNMEVCVTFQGYATPDHHCPTPKPVMLDDVPGSLMFTTASADSFMPITCNQCEPALTCVENELTVADLMILVFPRDCQATCTVLGWEHRSHGGHRNFMPPT